MLISARSGKLILPRPPSVRGVLTQAKWVKWESVETPRTVALISLNRFVYSEKAMSSVGHTYVKSKG